MCKEHIFKDINWAGQGASANGEKLNHFRFAVDTVIQANNINEEGNVLQDLDSRQEMGTEMIMKKTKEMGDPSVGHQPAFINGTKGMCLNTSTR